MQHFVACFKSFDSLIFSSHTLRGDCFVFWFIYASLYILRLYLDLGFGEEKTKENGKVRGSNGFELLDLLHICKSLYVSFLLLGWRLFGCWLDWEKKEKEKKVRRWNRRKTKKDLRLIFPSLYLSLIFYWNLLFLTLLGAD